MLDFFCREAGLVIELDGDSHAAEEAMRGDAERTRALERHGLRVIRFTNREVLCEMPRVLERIFLAIGPRR